MALDEISDSVERSSVGEEGGDEDAPRSWEVGEEFEVSFLRDTGSPSCEGLVLFV